MLRTVRLSDLAGLEKVHDQFCGSDGLPALHGSPVGRALFQLLLVRQVWFQQTAFLKIPGQLLHAQLLFQHCKQISLLQMFGMM